MAVSASMPAAPAMMRYHFDELFGSANIVVDGVQFFAAQIFGPHIGDVDVADQFVEGEAKIIAEKDQALEVRVRLPGFPKLRIWIQVNQFCR